jgi:hypothetical protein
LGEESILLPHFHGAKGYLAEPYESIDDEGLTQIKPEYPVAVDPPFIARRVAVQRSHFTIFGNDREGLTRLGENPGSLEENSYCKREEGPDESRFASVRNYGHEHLSRFAWII